MDIEDYTRVINAMDRERDHFAAFMEGVEVAIGQDIDNFDTIHDFRLWARESFVDFARERGSSFATIDEISVARHTGGADYQNAGIDRCYIEQGDKEIEWTVQLNNLDEEEVEKLRGRFNDG